MIRAIPAADLHQPVSRPHVVTTGPGRHVAIQQGIAKQCISRLELRRESTAEAANLGFYLGARVVGNQAHNLAVGPNPAKIAGAIQWMEARLHQFRGVPDVMEPSRCHEIFRQRQLLSGPPSPPGNRPHMPPATRQGSCQLGLGKVYSTADVDHGLDFTHGSRASSADVLGAG
jgi:hypothetical protein